MVWLGFSAGLPFLLVFSTLSAWLRDVGTDLSVIGFFSLVGVTYSVKVIWAPVVDRLPFPLLTRLLGKRRGWMLAAQLGIDEVAAGSFLRREPPQVRGTGFVVQSLEAAMWAFARGNDFRSGALLAVNLGDDADTTGAIYGQLAGAHYGVDGIPAHWLAALAKREQVELLASRLITGEE